MLSSSAHSAQQCHSSLPPAAIFALMSSPDQLEKASSLLPLQPFRKRVSQQMGVQFNSHTKDCKDSLLAMNCHTKPNFPWEHRPCQRYSQIQSKWGNMTIALLWLQSNLCKICLRSIILPKFCGADAVTNPRAFVLISQAWKQQHRPKIHSQLVIKTARTKWATISVNTATSIENFGQAL